MDETRIIRGWRVTLSAAIHLAREIAAHGRRAPVVGFYQPTYGGHGGSVTNGCNRGYGLRHIRRIQR
jgi:hypothetical protein